MSTPCVIASSRAVAIHSLIVGRLGLEVELRAPRVAAVAERLVEAPRVVDQRRILGRREAEVVPLERVERAGQVAEQLVLRLLLRRLDRQPADARAVGRAERLAPGGLRQQLPAEADAEHRHLAAQRVLDHRPFGREPRMLRVLVGIRRCRRARSGRRTPRADAPARPSGWRTRPRSRHRRRAAAPRARRGRSRRRAAGRGCASRKSYGYWTQGVSDGSTVTFDRAGRPAMAEPCGTRISIACGGMPQHPVDEQAAGRDEPVDGDAGAARGERGRRRDGLPWHALVVAGETEPVAVRAAASRRWPFDQRAVRALVRRRALAIAPAAVAPHRIAARPRAVRAPDRCACRAC